MKISDDQVRAAEEIASDVYDKQLSANEGAKLLSEVHGLNITSARDFINDYKHMLHGTLFQRAMSAPAISHFLSKILQKRGPKHHALAVSAVDQHVGYYEQLRGLALHRIRSVVDAHKKCAAPLQLTEITESFNTSVRRSLDDSAANRKARLSSAAKVPTKVPVISYAFVRNPDVVAEVLVRANGKCERCFNHAPFKRKENLQPYLEVHHVIQLSQDGEDTVENALALCPNCHHHLHFDVVSDLLYDTPTFELLIAHGASLTRKIADVPLTWALARGIDSKDWRGWHDLLESGANPNYLDEAGKATVMVAAIAWGQFDRANELLDYGFNTDLADVYSMTFASFVDPKSPHYKHKQRLLRRLDSLGIKPKITTDRDQR